MYSKKTYLSIILSLCILLTAYGYMLPVYAIDEAVDGNAALDGALVDPIVVGEKIVLSADDVPEMIDFASAKEKGHIMRLRYKETDDHTVVFLNEDNTETMYIFAEPVKYTDSSGAIKDKSTRLSLSGNSYVMAENDINVSFSQSVSGGISISKGDINISMTPIVQNTASGNLAAASLNENISADATATLVNNRVTYADVFGTADIKYTPLYSGFKEDIILDSYTGVNEFAFTVNTNGLYPVKNENGSVSFYDASTDIAVAEMMQVVCYDAAQNFAAGDVMITQVKQNSIYIFTVIADVEFLTAEDTVYPVSVDPTISLSSTTAIEDAVIYSGKPDSNFGSYHYNSVGYVDDTYKVGQLFVKFPTLASNSTFANLEETDVTSATLSLYTSSRGTGTVDIYRYDFGAWTESSITWNSIYYPLEPLYISSCTLPTGSLSEAEFNITSTVQYWASDPAMSSPDRGVILINSDPDDADARRSLLSTEYANANNSSVMPRLEISYGSTNSVKIELVDDDDAANNKIDVEEGIGRNFTVNLIYNGALISANGMLAFESLDTTIVRVPNVNAASVIGVSAGSAAIQATYYGVPRATALISVNVWEEKITFSSSYYTINNDTYANTIRGRTCAVRAYINRNTTKLAAHSGITYTIEGVDLREGSTQYSKSDTNLGFSVSSTGVLSYTIPNRDRFSTGLVAHPVGTIRIRATSSKATATVDIKVVCDDISLDDIDPNETLRKDGRYIRINYPVNKVGATLLQGRYSEFDLMLKTNWSNADNEFIGANFEKQDNGLFISADDAKVDFFDYVATAKVVAIMSHGTSEGNLIVNAAKVSTVISESDIMNLHQGYLKNCELILLYCCEGAENAIFSLAYSLADRGAKRVIAFHDGVDRGVVDEFEKIFYNNLCAGDSYEKMYDLYDATIKEVYDSDALYHSVGNNVFADDGKTIIKRIEYDGKVMIVGSHIDEFIFD